MSDITTLERLQVALEMQKQQFTEQIQNAQKQINIFKNSVDKTTDSVSRKTNKMFNTFKKVAIIGVAAKMLYEFGKGAINVASQLEEVQNVVDVSFGDMAYKIERFSKTSIESFGISELSAKKTASMFMSMGKGMGFLDEKSSNMAIQLTALSGDMASFYNISQERATTALKSIYTGETEALKQYGIAMTQTNLAEFARSKGIAKNIGDMSQAEQVTLRYMYVTKALSLANGDFARTSSSWSNQVRILSERFKQLAAIIGGGLIQAFTPIIQVINTVLSGLIMLSQAIGKVFGKLFGSSKVIESVNKSMSKGGLGAVNSQNALNGALKKNEGQAKKTASAIAGIDELNVINDDKGSGGSNTFDGIGGGQGYDLDFSNLEFKAPDEGPIEAFAKKIKKYFEPLALIDLTNLNISFSMFAKSLGDFGSIALDGIEWLYFSILVPLTSWTISSALPTFFKFLSASLNLFNSVAKVMKPLGQWLVESFLKPIAKWTGGVIVTVLNLISDALNGISNWISSNSTLFETLIIILGSFVAAWKLFLGVLNLVHTAGIIYNTIMALGTTITTAFGAALAFITSPIGLIVAAIAAVIAIVVLLIRHWDTVKEVAANTWNSIVDTFAGAAQWISDNIIAPIRDGFLGLINGVIGFFEGMINGIIGAFEGFINYFVSGINAIIEGVNGLSKYIGFTIDTFEPVSLGRVALPRFANGGIISGPTVGLMGEYANARSNPEVVAPLDKLKGLIFGNEPKGEDNLKLISLLEQQNTLLQAILNKDQTIDIDGREIARVSDKYKSKQGYEVFSY